MSTARSGENRILNLEAPGDLLSGLLGVSAASVLALRAGGVLNLPAAFGRWRLIAPQPGRLRLAWADRAWVLEERSAAVIAGAEELSILSLEDGAVCLIELQGSAADAVFRASERAGGLYFSGGGLAAERLTQLLSVRQPHPVPAKEASAGAYQLLMTLSGSGSAGPEEGKKLPPVVEAALGIMRRDFAFLDGVGELAARLEVSQEYLTRCFCRCLGVTPGRYLTQLRIENAKRLLREGKHSVQFVSDACGFSNANYFARVFRGSVGMNPRDYARSAEAQFPDRQDADENLYVL